MFLLVSEGYNVPETEMWNMPYHILLERGKQYIEKKKKDAQNAPICPLLKRS